MILRSYVLAILAFLFAPVVIIILFSFNASPGLTFPMAGFSLRWYQGLLENRDFLTALGNSLKVGLATVIVTTLLGTLTGLALIRAKARSRKIIEWLNFAPIGFPGLFLGIALAVLYGQLGLQRSLLTVTIAHVLFTLPFFVEAMRARITYFDPSVEEAARDLGATPLQVFWRVTIPILGPTIAGGAILTFALSFDEFVITVFVAGNESTLPVFIFGMMRRTVDPSINAASVIALVLSLSTLLLASGYAYMKRKSAVAARRRDA